MDATSATYTFEFAGLISLSAVTHNLKVIGSNPIPACRLDYLTDCLSRKFDANPRYRGPAAGLAAVKLIVGEVQPQVPDAHAADLVV
jgi:hypothetical protein